MRFVQPAQLHPDREITRMKSVLEFLISPINQTGTAQATGTSDMFFVSMNNIYQPGIVNAYGSGTPLNVMPSATGFTSLSLLYTNWQVRGCKVTARVNQMSIAGTGTPEEEDTEVFLVPLSTTNTALVLPTVGPTYPYTTMPYDRLRLMPGKSRSHLMQQSYAGGNRSTAHLHAFSSPQRIEGVPGYYTEASSWGTGTTAPTDSSTIAFAMSHPGNYVGTLGASPYFTIHLTVEYSVLWWGRKIPQIIGEKPHLGLPTEDAMDDEDKFDSIPEYKDMTAALDTIAESKEEKKAPPPAPFVPPALPQSAVGARRSAPHLSLVPAKRSSSVK